MLQELLFSFFLDFNFSIFLLTISKPQDALKMVLKISANLSLNKCSYELGSYKKNLKMMWHHFLFLTLFPLGRGLIQPSPVKLFWITFHNNFLWTRSFLTFIRVYWGMFCQNLGPQLPRIESYRPETELTPWKIRFFPSNPYKKQIAIT